MQNDIELYKNNFRHFSARLSLRYGILITFEYYVILCKLKYIKFSTTQKRKDGIGDSIIGYIDIHGQTARIVKSLHLKGKPLLTALKPAK